MTYFLNKVAYLLFFSFCIFFTVSCGDGEDAEKDVDCSDGVYIPFQEKEDGRWGFVNFSGDEVIPPEFKDKPTLSSNGISMVTEYHDGDKYYDFIKIYADGDKYKIDELGMKLLDALPFNEGVSATVAENSKIKYIDDEFNVLFTLNDIEYSSSFSNGLAAVQNIDGKWGFINKKGEIVIKCQYDKVTTFNDKHALVWENSINSNYVKIIDEKGEVTTNFKDKYVGFGLPSEGRVAVFDGSGWGFCDYKGGKAILIKPSWTAVTSFHNGYASFKKENEWGVIDKEGEVIVRSRYDNPLVFDNGLAPIIEDQLVGFIDKEGTKTIRPTFNEIAYGFACKNAIVKDGKYYIFIDKEGKQVNKNECRELVQNPNFASYRRSKYINTKFKNYIASNELEHNSIQSQFFDVDNLISSTVGNISDLNLKSKNIIASLNNLGFNNELEKGVNKSGTYFHKKQFKDPGSYMPPNISYSDVYVYFENKVKSPIRNEYGYVSSYKTNLDDRSNAVKEIKMKIVLKDKAKGKEAIVTASLATELTSLGYYANPDNSSEFLNNEGVKVALLKASRNQVALSLFYDNSLEPEAEEL
tara:strand:- start:1806 stop:3554 length:1749 start_codon:yes stop_codon:yes gene_type:complete